MANTKHPDIDLDASLKRLSDWLARRRDNEFDYAENSRRHNGLAERLRALAATLDEPEWLYLESTFDDDPPPEIGVDGLRIQNSGSNANRYQVLISRLRDLADTAELMASKNPPANSKPELPMTADFFLHLWLAAGKDRPKMYDKGEAVTALRKVMSAAKCELSPERVRGILSDALCRFDPFYCLDQWQLDKLIVYRQ